jgi:hypothetical protein
MHDPIIREALHKKVLKKHHQDKNTIVVDEFGLDHGSIRADIAVLNGVLHGYEIKSCADSLNRLPSQEKLYSAVFDKVTLVVSEKHLSEAIKIIPEWWGIHLVYTGKNGGIYFRSFRRGVLNKLVDPEYLARLLWRSEALDLLKKYEVKGSILRSSRHYLYEEISKLCNLPEIKQFVLDSIKSRECWRGHLQLS